VANFQEAYNKTALNEGGYRNVLWDLGGETYCGIARNYNPQWPGWTTIDQLKNNYPNGKIPFNTKFSTLDNSVKSFYQANYWNKIKGDAISNQAIANLTYDFVVQSGQAVRKMQEAINKVKPDSVTVDNQFGNQTLTAINTLPSVAVHNAILDERKAYYQYLLNIGKISDNDWNGILNRLAKYPYLTAAVSSIGALLLIGTFFFVATKYLNK
jgi:lysozyme family protein